MDIKIALVIVTGLLAGCKSATVSAAFQDLADTTDTLAAQVEKGTVSDPTDMPAGGSASYSGSAVFGASDIASTLLASPEMVSEVAMTADFQNGKVTGSFSNFEASSGKTVTGSLSLSNGTITGVDYDALAAGILNVAGTDQAVTGAVHGGFIGVTQDLIGGAFAGTRTVGTSASAFYGTFAASKD